MSAAASTVRRSTKFAARRTAILDAASEQINVVGVRGMTLTAVARALGMDTSSVTYYYRRKDDLAAACLERTLEHLRDAAAAAAKEDDEGARVAALIRSVVAMQARQREPGVSRLAVLSDLHSLDGETRAPLTGLYRELFDLVRRMFDRPAHAGAGLRTLALLGIVHWIPAWIGDYLTGDLDRVAVAICTVFRSGVGGGDLPDAVPVIDLPVAHDAQTRFLVGATELINRHGYHGASVDRIAAHLGVSVGSFYHHLDNKDDLVVACFAQSFASIERAFALVDAREHREDRRLGVSMAALLQLQLTGSAPLLRSGAYQALPPALRHDALFRFARLTKHLAGVIADGIGHGVLHPRDPLIAAHCLMAIVLAAIDLRPRAPDQARHLIAELVDIMRFGAIADADTPSERCRSEPDRP